MNMDGTEIKTQDTVDSDSKYVCEPLLSSRNVEYGSLKNENKLAEHEYRELKMFDPSTSLLYCCVPGADCIYNGHKRYDALDTALPVTSPEDNAKHHDCEPFNLGEPIVVNQDEPILGTPIGLDVFLIGTKNIVRLFMIDTVANDYTSNRQRQLHLLRKRAFLSNIKDGSTDPNIKEIRRGGRILFKTPPLMGHRVKSHWNRNKNDVHDKFDDSNNLLTFFIRYHDAQYHVNKQIKRKERAKDAYIVVYDDANEDNIKTYENAMENYCRKDDIHLKFYVKMVSSTSKDNDDDDLKKTIKLHKLKNVLSATYLMKRFNVSFDTLDIICRYCGIYNVNWNNYDFNYSWSMEKVNNTDVTHDEWLQSVTIKDIMIKIYDEVKKPKSGFCNVL